MKLFGVFGTDDATRIIAAEQRVAKAKGKLAALGVQLQDASRELEELRQAAVADAMERGRLDDSGNDIASASAGVQTLNSAIQKVTTELQAAQAALAAQQDAEARSKSVTEINAIVASIDEPLKRLLAALADLTDAVKRGANVSLDAKQLLGFLELASAELPVASAATVTALEHSAALIEHGSTPARLPVPETKPPARPAPPPQISCFPLYDVKWIDGAGLRHAGKYWDIGLAPEVAERAIAHGICVRSDDPQAVKKRKERGSMAADLDRAVDLDQNPPRLPEPLPERWINPHGVPKYSDVRQTAGPLNSWIGRPTHTPTNTENY